jgi:hypothetical protein
VSASVSAQTATLTGVATSTTSATLLAASSSRRGATIVNDSAGNLYVAFTSGTASATNFTVKLSAGQYYELPPTAIYSGPITGVLDAGTGTARVTVW